MRPTVGQVFGKLTVVHVPEVVKSHTMIKCLCSCGKKISTRESSLRYGSAKSCGCARVKLSDEQFVARQMYAQYRHGAKQRGYSFEITLAEFSSLISQDCSYCGQKPKLKDKTVKSKRTAEFNGVDRKDNKIGYLYSNCASACSTCNKAKGTMDAVEFVYWIKKVADNLKIR